MNKKSMGPDLKVFKSSRSCNNKIIPKINKNSNITNVLHLCGTSLNKAKPLLVTVMNFVLVIILYFEDKKIDDTPSYYNDHWKKNKAAFRNL